MTAITIADLTNAKTDVDHIADIATSVALTSTDRLGNVKDTISGAVYKITSFVNRSAWVTATAYAVKDLVSNAGTWYVCVVAHTSSAAFATDTASKWRVYQGVITGDLAASSGASMIGFMPSGIGAVAMTVQNFLRRFVIIEGFGADSTQAGDSAAIKAAITYAETLNLPVLLPARRIYWDGSAITNDKVRLWGSGMPTVNSGKTALSGGTVIEGKLICTGKYVDLRDFGVDLGTGGAGADADGIKCTCATLNGGVHLHTENLIALCKYKTSAVHSILLESYQKHTGGNLYGVNGYFGCVIKNQNVQLSSIETDTQTDTGLYLKSDSTWGTCSNVQIGQVRNKTADGMGIRVQSDSADLINVQIGAVHSSDCGRSVIVQLLDPSGTNIKSVHIDSLLSERSTTSDLSIFSSRAGKTIDNVIIGDLISINPTAKVIECSSTGSTRNLGAKHIYASYAAGTAQATMDNAVFIDAGVLSTSFETVEIVENYGAGTKIGAINYQNTADPKAHILGAHRCKIIGGGRPIPGNLNQTLSGATATLQIPENINGTDRSIVKVTIAANTTITIFTPEVTDHVFATGHVLMVLNNSAFTLTVNHNVGGGIINSAGANVAIAGNEVAMWVNIGGIYWAQLKIA